MDVHPRHVGHHEIAEHDVECLSGLKARESDTPARLAGNVVLLPQGASQGGGDQGLIVDDEDLGANAIPPESDARS